MTADRFGRTPDQAKSDQRAILEKAYHAYPDFVDARLARKDTPERFDIHVLLDHGLLQHDPHYDRRGVVGDSTFVPMYRLSVTGYERIRQPNWLNEQYPMLMSITAHGSSININSPGASATTDNSVNILLRLREEIERSDLPPTEKAGLLDAIGKLSRHPLVIALIAKLLSGA